MIKQAYISCPLTVASEDLEKVIKLVKGYNLNRVHYYGRGTAYNTEVYDQVIRESDAFILILPDMKWSIMNKKLTAGCKRELAIAHAASRKLYLAYKLSNGTIGIYQATFEYSNPVGDHVYIGQSGTSEVFAQQVAEGNRYTRDKVAYPVPASKTHWAETAADEWAAEMAKPKVYRTDVAKYASQPTPIFAYANDLYNKDRNANAEDYHKAMDAHIKAEREKAKVAKLAEHYGAKKQSFPDMIQQQAEDYAKQAFDNVTHQQSFNKMLADFYQAEKRLWDGGADFKNPLNKKDKSGIDYHELIRKHLEHRTPAQEQPLAMLLPKEALAPKEGDKVDSNGYTVEFKNGVWEWEIKNPNYIDERLLMFF